MTSKFLTRIFTVVSLISLVMIAFNSFARVKAQSEVKSANPSSFWVELNDGVRGSEIYEKILKDKNLQNIQITSQFDFAGQTITDFTGAADSAEVTNIESKLQDSRTKFLLNLKNTQKVGSEESIAKKFNDEDIDKTVDTVTKEPAKLTKLSFVSNIENVTELKSQIESTGLANEVKLTVLDTKQTTPVGPKVSESMSNLAKLGGVEVAAQSTPNWVPNQVDTYFFDSDEWQNVNATSSHAYSLTQWNGQVCLSFKGATNTKLYFSCRFNGVDFNLSTWEEAPGDTADAPASVGAYGRYYQTIRGLSNNVYIRYYNNGWTGWTNIGGTTYSAPAIGFHNNQLCVLVRGDNNKIYIKCSGDGINFPANWIEVGGDTYNAPFMVSANGRFYMGTVGIDNLIYIKTSVDGYTNWTGWQSVGRTTDQAFSIVGTYGQVNSSDRVCITHKGYGNTNIYQGCAADGLNFGNWVQSSGATNNAPVSLYAYGKMYRGARGLSGNWLYLQYSADPTGSRGYYSFMKWDNPTFQSNEGYEQDILLYNYDDVGNKTYLSKNDSGYPNCFPTIRYALSGLPNAYLDTRLFREWDDKCDSNNTIDVKEVTYTIGSGTPNQISSNIFYFNYMELDKGELSYPIFKVNANLGEKRIPPNCLFGNVDYTWCVFSKDNVTITTFDLNINRNNTYPYWYKHYQR